MNKKSTEEYKGCRRIKGVQKSVKMNSGKNMIKSMFLSLFP